MKQVYDKKKPVPPIKYEPPSRMNPKLLADQRSPKVKKNENSTLLKSLSPKASPKAFPSPMLSPSTMYSFEHDSDHMLSERPTLHQEPFIGSSKMKSFENTFQRNQDSYQTQVYYMQEYINFLKRKLLAFENQSASGENPSETHKLQQEINYLHQIIQEKDIEANNYLNELCEKQSQLFELTDKFKKYNEKTDDEVNLKKRISEETLIAEQELKRYYEKKVADLENALFQTKANLDNKNREVEFFRKEIQGSQREIDDASDKLMDKISDCIERNDMEFKRMQEKVEMSENKLFSLMKTVRFLQTSSLHPNNTVLKAKELEITEKFEKEIGEKIVMIDSLTKKIDKATVEKEQLFENIEDLQRSVSALEKKLQEEVSLHEFSKAQNEESLQQIESLTSKIQTLEDSLADHIGNLQEKAQEINHKSNHIEALNTIITSKKEKLVRKKTLIQESNKKQEELLQHHELKQEEFEGKVNDLMQEIEKYKDKIEEFKGSELEKTRAIGNLDKMVLEKVGEIDELNEKIRDFQGKLIVEIQENERLAEELKEKIQSVESLSQEKGFLQEELDEKKGNLDEKAKKNAELAVEVDMLKQKLEDKASGLAKLEEILESQNKSIEKLVKTNNSLKEQLQQHEKNSKSNASALISYLSTSSSSIPVPESQQSLLDSLNEHELEYVQTIIKQNEQLKNFHIQNKEYAETIESLQNDINLAKESYEQEIALAIMEKDEKIKQVEGKMLMENQKFVESVDEKNGKIEDMTRVLEETSAKIIALELELQNYKIASLKDTNELSKVVFQMTEDNKNLRISESRLKKDVTNLTSQNSDLQEKISNFDTELTRLSNENLELRNKLQDSDTKNLIHIQKQDKIIQELNESLHKSIKLSEDLEINKKILQESLKTSANDNENYIQELLEHIQNLQNEVKSLQEISNKKSVVIENLESKVSQMSFRFSVELQRYTQKLLEKDTETKEFIRKDQENESKKTELVKEIVELKEKIVDHEKIIFKAETDLKNSREKALVLIRNEEKAKEKTAELIKELDEDKRNIEILKEKNNKLDMSLKEIQNVLSQRVQKHQNDMIEMETQSEDYQKTIKGLKENIENLQDEVKKIKIGHIQSEGALAQENSMLKEKIEDHHTKESSLTRENLDLLKINSELKAKINSFDRKLVTFTEENCALRKKIDENEFQSQRTRQKLENTISDLELSQESLKISLKSELQLLTSEKHNISSQLSLKESQHNKLLIEIEDYRRSLEKSSLENHNLTSKLQRLTCKFADTEESYTKTIETLQKRLKDQNSEHIKTLSSKNSEEVLSLSLKELNQDLEESLNSYKNQTKKLESTISSLENEKDTLADQNKTLEIDMNSLKNSKQTLEDTLLKKKSKLREFSYKIAELKENSEKQTENFDETLRSEKRNSHNLRLDIDTLREKFERIMVENESLKVKILEGENHMNKAYLSMEEERNVYKSNEKRMNNENDLLGRKKKELMENNQELEEKLESFRVENQDFIRKNEELNKKTIVLEKECYKVRSEFSHIDEELKKVEEIKVQLEGSLKNREEFIDELQEANKNAEKSLREKDKVADRLQNTVEMMEEQVKGQEGIIKQLKTDYFELVSSVSALEAEVDANVSLKQKIASLESSITTLSSLNAEFKQEIEKVQAEKQELEETFTYKLQDLTRENDNLQDMLKNQMLEQDLIEKNLKHEHVRLEGTIDKLKLKIEEAKQDFMTIQLQKSEAETKNKQFLHDFPEEQHEMLKKVIQDLSNGGLLLENTQVDERNLEILKMKTENEKIRGEASEALLKNMERESFLSKEIKRLNEDLKVMILTDDKKAKEVQKLKQKLGEVEEKNNLLQLHIQKLFSEKSSTISKLEELSNAHCVLVEEKDVLITSLSEEKALLKTALNKLASETAVEKSEFLAEINEKTSVIEKINDEINELRGQSESQTSEIEANAGKIKELEKEVAKVNEMYRKDVEEMRNVANEQVRENEVLCKETEEMMEKLKFKENRLKTAEDDVGSLTIEVKELKRINEELKMKIEKMTIIMNESSSFEIHELKEKVIDLETQLVLAGFQREKDYKEIKTLEELNLQRINSYKINVLEEEVGIKKSEIDELIIQNQRLQHELYTLKENIDKKDKVIEKIIELDHIASILVSLNPSSNTSTKDLNDLISKARICRQKIRTICPNFFKN